MPWVINTNLKSSKQLKYFRFDQSQIKRFWFEKKDFVSTLNFRLSYFCEYAKWAINKT